MIFSEIQTRCCPWACMHYSFTCCAFRPAKYTTFTRHILDSSDWYVQIGNVIFLRVWWKVQLFWMLTMSTRRKVPQVNNIASAVVNADGWRQPTALLKRVLYLGAEHQIDANHLRCMVLLSSFLERQAKAQTAMLCRSPDLRSCCFVVV